MLNLRIPISITGLAVAAVTIGAYHHFVEPLFPATGMDLFWIVYVASGFNLYGYFFRSGVSSSRPRTDSGIMT